MEREDRRSLRLHSEPERLAVSGYGRTGLFASSRRLTTEENKVRLIVEFEDASAEQLLHVRYCDGAAPAGR